MEMILILVVFVGLMYVMMVLPQKRKMEAQKKLLESLQPGARVMLNTGIFGTIRANGERQMVIELAPGVEVTVLKQAVVRELLADEEEFVYTDDDDEPVADSFQADAPSYTQPVEADTDQDAEERPQGN